MLKIANDDVTKLYVGTSAVTKAFLQDVQVWPNTPDYSSKYFTIEAIDSGTFKMSKSGLTYSFDNGQNWTALPSGTTVAITAGDKVMFRGTPTPQTGNGIGKFTLTGRFNVEGNIMSLLFGENYRNQTNLNSKIQPFRSLFNGCSGLINAENLVLPATTLAEACYYDMFGDCSSLITTPVLPATVMKTNCYDKMFRNCSSLTTAPALPATTMGQYCYQSMFDGCSGLTAAPELPATATSTGCYAYMFRYCTGLTSPSVMSATTIASGCCRGMYYDCYSLATAPALPATTLGNGCYNTMFYGCSGLTAAPALPATTLTTGCYQYMFSGCTGIQTAPVLSASTLTKECYYGMFARCSNLNYVKMIATDISASNCLTNWLQNVAATGHFVKAQGVSIPTGASGIPNGWTVEADVIEEPMPDED